ncbi:Ldh family oxidoreductase [Rhodovibrionaceae bacterium A322]
MNSTPDEPTTETLTVEALRTLLLAALTRQGFSTLQARALTEQTLLSELLGQQSVGVAHLPTYLDGVKTGRVQGKAVPEISRPAPTILSVDSKGGLAQAGFDLAFDDLVQGARHYGLQLFLNRNSTTCGSLGTFALRLAEEGLVALAATNGPALLAGSGGTEPVFCTNPLAFAAPRDEGPALLIDQSSSATAYVNIRAAAQRGESIPEGWALDKDGQPTCDPRAALEGTLLSFGGARGANLALMVEVLAAGLSGANWSLDAPSFNRGPDSPATGLFVLAINPQPAGQPFSERLGLWLTRLSRKYAVHIPGLSKAQKAQQHLQEGISVDAKALDDLRALAEA